MQRYTLRGVDIEFPFPAYDVQARWGAAMRCRCSEAASEPRRAQVTYMDRVVEALQRVRPPTGQRICCGPCAGCRC